MSAVLERLTVDSAQRSERDRSVTYSWRLGTFTMDGTEEWADGIELSMRHDKDRKAITVTAYRVGYMPGVVRHIFDLRGGTTSARVAVIPCQRYSAKALRDAEAVALEHLDAVSDWALGGAA